jgi:hypothetical protein
MAMRTREQQKAIFAKMFGKMTGHMKGAIKIKEPEDSRFAVSPAEVMAFRDPMAIQPQNSFLMGHPELGIGFGNMESRRPKKG